jgi:O-antigen/teichoic acid export membrane protein
LIDPWYNLGVSGPYSEENLDSAIELSLETVKKRAVRGVAILTGRGFVLNAVSQVSQIMLLAFLSPSELGTFWIVSAAVAFFVYFSDVGLAAALIQRKERPSDSDLKTTFSVQQSLVLCLLFLLWLLTPYFVRIYGLGNEGKYLLWALGVSLLLSSLKSIPSVLLERRLEFGKFVLPEILENLCYNLTVVGLAWKGFGLMSFAWAVLVRGVVGVVTIYALQPWKPGIAFSRKAIGGLLKFGVPYQANTLISVFKDQGVTLILGGVLGQAAVGYLGSAMRLSQIPLRLFMDNVTKVSFPAFSRMQGKGGELSRSVTRSIQFITFLVYPSLFGFLVIVPSLMLLIPKYQKWEPAVIPLLIVSVNVVFAAVATQLTNMLTAIGEIRTTIKITIMYSVLTIILVPLLAYMGGVVGAAWGYALVGSSSVVAIYVAKRRVNFSLVESSIKPFAAALVMAGSVLIMKLVIPIGLIGVFLMIASGVAVYALFSYLFIGSVLVGDAKKIIRSFFGG